MAESQKAPLPVRGLGKFLALIVKRPLLPIWLVLGAAMVLFPASPVAQVGLYCLGLYVILLFCAMFGAGWAAFAVRAMTPFVPARKPVQEVRR